MDNYMCLWWILAIGVFSQYKVYGMFIADRYMYLANVAFCVLIAKTIGNTPLYFIIATFWFMKSWEGIKIWRNNLTLFSHSSHEFPESPENLNNLAGWYMSHRRWDKAIEPLLISYKLNPIDFYQVVRNIAHCYELTGQFEKSLVFLHHSLNCCHLDQKKKVEDKIMELNNKQRDLKHNWKMFKKITS